MRNKNLWLSRCRQSYKTFRNGNEYIFLKKDSSDNRFGYYIDNEGLVQVVENNLFVYSRELVESFFVIGLYSNKNGTLVEGNEYSVYRINDDDTFTILDESNILRRYNKDYFIRNDLYIKYQEQGILDKKLTEHKEFIYTKIKKINEEEKQKQKEELERKERKKEKDRLAKEKADNEKFILKVINTVGCKFNNINDEVRNDDKVVENTNNKHILFKITITLLVAYSLVQKSTMSIFEIVLWSILLNIVMNFSIKAIYNHKKNKIINKKNKDNQDKKIEENKVLVYKRNETLSKLDLNILGKIKKIELNIDMLQAIDGDSQIISLLKESISLTLNLNEFTDIDVSDKLNEFLDNTLEYINTLNTNKQIEEKYIKKKLAENITDVIDKNNNLFKSMIKDNHNLNKYITIE